ncbi:MAG: maleate isomerase [Actinomycetota bacterium]|jgi:maleate isomerase|nr:maleate isomerase [Actinomycetota bacterium]
MSSHRIGLIVPSSNTTMETEVPELLRRQQQDNGMDTFTFHSSRMRMQEVSREELARMDAESDRCALELSDARCDVLAYACLVAIMSMGNGYHRVSQDRLAAVAAANGAAVPVVSSAGALIDALTSLGVRRTAILTPYLKPLTDLVAGYIEDAGVEVADRISLEVPDNLEVGRLDPADLLGHARKLDLNGVDALVLSACVQMPSLPAVQQVEDELGLPVITAATATARSILLSLQITPQIRGAGQLLAQP